MTKAVVLTIAGSDCSGGAGIQADLATIAAHGLYGESVITAVTAQNTRGVQQVYAMNAACIAAQLDSVFSDIVPAAVKIGMIPDAAAAEVIAAKLVQYGCGAQQNLIPVVIDPVLVSTSGTVLLTDDARDVLVQRLFPLASLITPNIPEAESLAAGRVSTARAEGACRINKTSGLTDRFLAPYPASAAVLVKGGHAAGGQCSDTLYLAEKGGDGVRLVQTSGSPSAENCGIHTDAAGGLRSRIVFSAARLANRNTHGTGCTLSSAIACGLAENVSVEESVRRAKAYITRCISADLQLGSGRGPLWHF